MDDEVGSLVEKLKPQFVTKWLKTVCDVRFDVMVMCLLPKPMEFARVRRRALSFLWQQCASLAKVGCRYILDSSTYFELGNERMSCMSEPL